VSRRLFVVMVLGIGKISFDVKRTRATYTWTRTKKMVVTTRRKNQ
jgi:hypothetical protein